MKQSLGAQAEGRVALLIANQSYSEKVGRLKNPHNDIALVGAALEKIGFNVTRIKDAGYKVIDMMMFRTVQLKVKQAIGQDPWLSFPTLPAVYFAGTKPASC